MLRRFVNWVLAHQRFCAFAIVALTLVAMTTFLDIGFRTTLAGMFFGDDHQEYSRYQSRTKQFGSDETIVVGVEHNAPFSKSNLERLDAVHTTLEEREFIYRVTSLRSVRRVGLVGDTIAVRSLSDDALANPGKADDLLSEARRDPLMGSRLVSLDEGHFTVVIDFKADQRSAEDAGRRIKEIRSAFTNAGYEVDQLKIAGGPAVMSGLIEASYENLRVVLPVVCLTLLLAVFLMFGRWWPVVVTTSSAFVAVAWTMGISLALDPYLNIMMTLVPALVLVISFSDVVHICSAYLIKCDEGIEKREALIEATVEVGSACFLTSITTAIGFISMAFVPTPMFQRVGTISAMGVCLAYLVALVVVPIMLDRLPAPSRWTDRPSVTVEFRTRSMRC